MTKRMTSLIVALAAAAQPSVAQAAGPDTGCASRVRITAPSIDHARLVGKLLRADEQTLTIWRDGKGALEVPRSAVAVFEVCRQRGQKARGLRRGALVGLTVATLGALASIGGECHDFVCFSPAAVMAMGTVTFVPLGALVGLGIAPGDEWEQTTPDRVSVVVAPGRDGGVRAAVSFRF